MSFLTFVSFLRRLVMITLQKLLSDQISPHFFSVNQHVLKNIFFRGRIGFLEMLLVIRSRTA